jgi:ferric-dicitrate binding protein FerR (iron transport regulator)
VRIKGLQVEVLGTSFNVKAYPDDKQSFTTLVEGKVKLNSVLQTSVVQILEPDQQAVFDPSTSAIFAQKVDARQFIQWITGKYTFTNQPLDEMMKTLARWYDFNYQFEEASLKNIRFEGGLNKYQSIDPILEIINKTGKVKVSVKGKEVLFSKI